MEEALLYKPPWIQSLTIVCLVFLANVSCGESQETNATTERPCILGLRKTSYVMFGIFGFIFGLANLLCCCISVAKAISDRQKIKERNVKARRKKQEAMKKQNREFRGKESSAERIPIKLAVAVDEAIHQNMNKVDEKNNNNNSNTLRVLPAYEPGEPQNHYFSHSPTLRRLSSRRSNYPEEIPFFGDPRA
ncbi:unnamed protein product [Calicophoron daubneyi]|uniref:Transmembrane protein n=1 Tax=Calicophoron daubneyi TaxID=300641 RepID=A0AAV2TBL3_CALDB